MNIERFYYREKVEQGLDTRSVLEYMDKCGLSEEEIRMGQEALAEALMQCDLFERMHPRIESPERVRRFEQAAQNTLEMAELFGLDISIKTNNALTAYLTITGDTILLRREYSCNFLPLMKQLMDMCDEFFVDSVEKYGRHLTCFSFEIPLYVRGVSL